MYSNRFKMNIPTTIPTKGFSLPSVTRPNTRVPSYVPPQPPPPPPPPPRPSPPPPPRQRPRTERDTTLPPLFPLTGCAAVLKREGIATRKDFRSKWALKNHPDRGGDTAKFQVVSDCVDQLGARRRTRKRRATKKRKTAKRKSVR